MKVGVAIYSLMGLLREDYFGTLEQLARTGCQYIEYVTAPEGPDGSPAASAAEIGRRVAAIGFTPVSSHVAVPDNGDAMKQLIEDAHLMGAPRLVLPFETMNSVEEIQLLADKCNRMGRLCAENGLQFFYHNHFQEFMSIEGSPAIDWYLSETDPNWVHFEMDAYWVKRAGHNPVEVLKLLGSRCTMIHQKDLSAAADPVNLLPFLEPPVTKESFRDLRSRGLVKADDFVPVGQGILDVPGLVETAKALGHIDYILVELDNLNRIDAVQESLDYLKALEGVCKIS